MHYKLIKTGKSYAEPREEISVTRAFDCVHTDGEINCSDPEDNTGIYQLGSIDLPIIWETGNIPQIHSLLVIRQAELEVAKSKLAGNDRIDWYVNNRIMDLEIKIADLKLWLTKAMKQREDAI